MDLTKQQRKYLASWREGKNGSLMSDVPNPSGDNRLKGECADYYGGPYMVCETICDSTAGWILSLVAYGLESPHGTH